MENNGRYVLERGREKKKMRERETRKLEIGNWRENGIGSESKEGTGEQSGEKHGKKQGLARNAWKKLEEEELERFTDCGRRRCTQMEMKCKAQNRRKKKKDPETKRGTLDFENILFCYVYIRRAKFKN